MEEKEGKDGTEEEILDRGYRLGSRDRRCSNSTCPKAFVARSFRLIPRSSPNQSFQVFFAISSYRHGNERSLG